MARRSVFGTVRKLPSGRYQARYEFGADRTAVNAPTTFAKRADAQAWLAAEQLRIQHLSAGSPKAVVKKLPRFADYARDWIEERDIRPSTKQTYRKYLRLHVGSLGKLPLDDITPATIREWYKKVAPGYESTRAKTYAFVKAVFATAVADDLIDAQPCRIRGGSAAKVKTEVEVLSPQQVIALADEVAPQWRCTVLFGAWCQLRVGEVLALRKKNIDTKNWTVSVDSTVTWDDDGSPVYGPPKTNAGIRVVSIPSAMQSDVKSLLKDREGGPETLLFHGMNSPGKPPRAQTFSDHIKRASHRAGLPTQFRFHHLRHSGLTLLAEAGASVAELQSRAGHTTPTMALKYQHARAERDRMLADRLSEAIGGSSGK